MEGSMMYWDMIYAAIWEMTMAAQLAQQECLELIGKWRFSDAENVGKSRDAYYDCALQALKML
jgi:hypothetical protein